MKIKIIATIAAFVIPLTINATNLFEHIEQAKKCHQLAVDMENLAKIQNISFCKEKILDASLYTEYAGQSFMMDEISLAKDMLKFGISSLSYTAVENCNGAGQIQATKNSLEEVYRATSNTAQ